MLRPWTVSASVVLGAVVLAALAWAAVQLLDMGRVVDVAREASVPALLLAMALTAMAYLMGGVAWWVLLYQERAPMARTVLLNVGAIGLNNLSPVRVIGEPVEFGVLTLRDKLPAGAVFGSIALHRFVDIGVLAAFVGGGLVVLPLLDAPWPAVLAGFVLLPVLLALFFFFGRRATRVAAIRRFTLFKQLERYADYVRQAPAQVAMALGAMAGYRLGIGLAGWAVALAIDLPLGFVAAMVVSLTALFLSVNIPGFIAGIGVFEVAVLLLLTPLGVEEESALAFALLLHAVTIVPPLLAVFFFLPWEGIRSFGAVREMLVHWREHRAHG